MRNGAVSVRSMESLEDYAERSGQSLTQAYVKWHEAGHELALALNRAEKAKANTGIMGTRSLGLTVEDLRQLQAAWSERRQSRLTVLVKQKLKRN